METMKTVGGILLVAACFVAHTHSFPGSRDSENVDTVLVLPSDVKERIAKPMTFDLPDMSFDDSIEDVSSSWGWPSPAHQWYSGIEPVMNRFREIFRRMFDVLSYIPEQGAAPWGKIPEGANTTSTTKIIDGHVVTINETTYMDGDDEYGTMIRVRVIDVKPQNETILKAESEADAEVTTLPTMTGTTRTAVSSEESSTASRSVETVEDFDNEIPKNQVDTLAA